MVGTFQHARNACRTRNLICQRRRRNAWVIDPDSSAMLHDAQFCSREPLRAAMGGPWLFCDGRRLHLNLESVIERTGGGRTRVMRGISETGRVPGDFLTPTK